MTSWLLCGEKWHLNSLGTIETWASLYTVVGCTICLSFGLSIQAFCLRQVGWLAGWLYTWRTHDAVICTKGYLLTCFGQSLVWNLFACPYGHAPFPADADFCCHKLSSLPDHLHAQHRHDPRVCSVCSKCANMLCSPWRAIKLIIETSIAAIHPPPSAAPPPPHAHIRNGPVCIAGGK